MQYLLLFLEGIITFISPCLMPLLPVYISIFAAGEAGKRRALVNSAGFVVGFTLVFMVLGAFAGTFGKLLREYAGVLNVVTGLIVVVLGLNFIGIVRIKFLNAARKKESDTNNLRFFSALMFGAAFSVSWTPCVGAFLGSALMTAARGGGTLTGILMLFIYSLGVGLPFVISAVLIDRLKAAFDFIKSNYRVINILAGSLLILAGVLMATGFWGRFLLMLSF